MPRKSRSDSVTHPEVLDKTEGIGSPDVFRVRPATTDMRRLDRDGGVAVSQRRLMHAHRYRGPTALVGCGLWVRSGVARSWHSSAWRRRPRCAPRTMPGSAGRRPSGGHGSARYQKQPLIAGCTAGPDPGVRVKSRASRIPNLARLVGDGQAVGGHGPMLAGTFVDRARFLGTDWQAARHRSRAPARLYTAPRGLRRAWGPKRVWVYPLPEKARPTCHRHARIPTDPARR